eukprot:403118-Prymnesium_polylepis.1
MDKGKLQDVKCTDVSPVNLYDVNAKVILPATLPRKCAMVELLASEDQPPDFFTSHYWGETIVDFLACLVQHVEDRGTNVPESTFYLGDDRMDTRYWVCAHANRQHDFASEIGGGLSESSFYLAMQSESCRGVVSIIDKGGVVWSRI